MGYNNFNPDLVTVGLGSIIARQFVRGSHIRLEWDEDHFIKVAGVKSVVRVQVHIETARCTINLAPNSPTNDQLSALLKANKRGTSGAVPFFLKDINGTTLITAPNAWVVKPASYESAGDDAPGREWMIDMDEATGVVGSLTAV